MGVPRAPAQAVERLQVQALEHPVQGHVRHDLVAPEGHLGNRLGRRRRGLGAFGRLGHHRALAVLGRLGLGARLLDQRLAALGVHQLVDQRQALEGVVGVEHARIVELAFLQVEDAQAVALVDGRAADDDRVLQPAVRQLLERHRHLLGGAHEQGGKPDGVRADLFGLVENGVDRHLLTEIEDRVAVVGQDRVDEVLADVVHVAVYGREHHLALGRALGLLEELLDVGHGLFHDLGGLQHERQNQLASAELVAHVLHGRQEHLVEDRHGRPARHGLIQQGLDAGLFAVQDLPVDGLLGRHAGGGVDGVGAVVRDRHALEVGDVGLQGVGLAVEDQVLGHRALLGRNLGQGLDVRRVHDGEVQPGLHAVVQEDRVEHVARRRAQPEAHVAHAEHRHHAGHGRLDRAKALDRLDRRAPELLVARREREGQIVEDQRLGLEPVLAHGDVVNGLGDFQLALGGLRHAHLVDGQGHHRGAVLDDHRQDRVAALAAVFQVDRVDDRPARVGPKRFEQHGRLGAVEHQGALDAHGELLDHLGHGLFFVGALGQGHADVEHVRAVLHLIAAHLDHAVHVVRQQELLQLAAALRVDALAHDEGLGLLVQRHGANRARHRRHVLHLAPLGRAAADPAGQLADVVRRGAAAAADDLDAEVRHELLDGLAKRLGLLGVDRAAVHVQGQAGVRQHADGQPAALGEEPEGLAHVLGARRAVQADDVDRQGLERGVGRQDVRAQEHAPADVERDLHLERHATARLLEVPVDADHGRLDLQDVLAGLDQEHVAAALHEGLGLLLEDVGQFLEGDLGESRVIRARQHARRADRARHEARLLGRAEAVGLFARQGRRLVVELVGELLDAVLGHLQPVAAEGVGLDDVGAGLEVVRVHLGDHVRAGDDQVVVRALFAAEVLEGQLQLLQAGAHGPVINQDAGTKFFEEAAHETLLVDKAARHHDCTRFGPETPSTSSMG
ncbi:hypothetical protein D3C72_699740 [compost metagenome]